MSTFSQKSFAGGELTPALWQRTDQVKYQTGLKTCRNAFIGKQGGAKSRPGTNLVAEVKDSTKQVRLIPFVFNNTQTYVLEFGNKYLRLHQNGAPVLIPTPAAYNGGTAYNVGDYVSSGGINYQCTIAGTGNTPATTRALWNVATAYVVGNVVNLNGTYYTCNQNNTAKIPSSYSDTALGAGDYWNLIIGYYEFWYPLTGNIFELPTLFLSTDLLAIDYVQSADVMTFVHPSYYIMELKRNSPFFWSFAFPNLQTNQVAPTITGLTNGGGTFTYFFRLTAVNDQTGEESFYSTIFNSPGVAQFVSGGTSTMTLTWNAAPGATYYNVYLQGTNGIYGLLGQGTGGSYLINAAIALAANFLTQPPLFPVTFNSVTTANLVGGDSPSCVSYIQQRLTLGNTPNNPTAVWMSRSACYHNFSKSIPSVADDSISLRMAGQQVHPIKHILDLGKPLVFTEAGEWSIEGDSGGVISPAAAFPKQHSYEGCANIKPLVVSGDALYVQALGSTVRNLAYDYVRGKFDGQDLSIFSSHLFEGFNIVDWGYQKTPQSIVWAVRSDGVMLSLTYIREQQIAAWTHHDTDGRFENVCCLPEGNEYSAYVVVNRTINGTTKRFIEVMTQRRITNVVDFIGMDCANTYDGRNTSATTMTLTGGTQWNETETLTLTASAGTNFSAVDVTNQNQVFLTGSDGKLIRFTIKTYTSATVVSGLPDRTVPASLRSTATLVWSKAVSHLSGLSNLEGKSVSVFADGYVVGSPNNTSYPTYTVTAGALILDKPYAVVHVGLAMTADIETLDIDSPQGETITDKFKLVGNVTLHLKDTRGVFIGGVNPDADLRNTSSNPLFNLTEIKMRQYENYDSPIALETGKVSQNIQSEWDSNGHIFLRQVDPLPMEVLAIAPDGLFPFKGAG